MAIATKSSKEMEFDFTVNSAVLRSALSVVSLTLDKRKEGMGSCLYLCGSTKNDKKQLILFSSDGSQTSMMSVPAEVAFPGSLLVSPALLIPILATLAEEAKVRFSMKPGATRMQVTSGTIKINLPVFDKKWHEEMLKSMPFLAKPVLSLPAYKLREVIDRTSSFVSKDDSMYVLHNLVLETKNNQLSAYACDNRAVARATIDGLTEEQNNFELMLHSKFIEVFRKVLNRIKDSEDDSVLVNVIFLKEGDVVKRVFIRTPDVFYGTVTATGTYPNVKQAETSLIVNNSIRIDRQALLNCLKRIGPFCCGLVRQEKGLKLTVEDKVLRLQGKSDKIEFQEEIDLKDSFSGNAEVFLSFSYLQNAIQSLTNDDLYMRFTEQKSAILIQSGDVKHGYSSYVLATAKE